MLADGDSSNVFSDDDDATDEPGDQFANHQRARFFEHEYHNNLRLIEKLQCDLEMLEHDQKNLFAECECSICCLTLYRPTTLSCGHTFCAFCLQNMVTPICPQCRTRFVPFQTKPNILIQSLLISHYGNREYEQLGMNQLEISLSPISIHTSEILSFTTQQFIKVLVFHCVCHLHHERSRVILEKFKSVLPSTSIVSPLDSSVPPLILSEGNHIIIGTHTNGTAFWIFYPKQKALPHVLCRHVLELFWV